MYLMAKKVVGSRLWLISFFLLVSVAVNIYFLIKLYKHNEIEGLSWSVKAAAEAESVASIDCSNHGRAHLDGVVYDGKPICECNSCYGGSDCSRLLPDCEVDANSGDPLFLEPFWRKNAAASAVVVAGWHRMSYTFPDQTLISKELEKHIRLLHDKARNAVTDGKYIVFGVGSTQLSNAAVYALSENFTVTSPASVVAAIPFYPFYQTQTDYFENKNYTFEGDASLMEKNRNKNIIEFVTSPNNPGGELREPLCKGPNARAIYDRAYYWPHFSAIPSPADDDIMIFTMSKITGHAGSRFGWAFVKDEEIYKKMKTYILNAEMGTSRDTQLRALQIMKTILHENDNQDIFDYAFEKLSYRWGKISQIISKSKRFSIQKILSMYCNYFHKVRGPSPGYAWVKCEDDANCFEVLKTAKILGRAGEKFHEDASYVRLSLLMSDDQFDLLLDRLQKLVDSDQKAKIASKFQRRSILIS